MSNSSTSRRQCWVLLSLISWLIFSAGQALALPAWNWARQGNASVNSRINDLATDPSNNTYAVGQFAGTLSLGSSTISSAGAADFDGFLTRLNNAGNVSWTIAISGSGAAVINNVAVDASGAVWITGNLNGSNTFGSTSGASQTVSGPADNDLFVARYSAAGVLQWVTLGGGNSLSLEAKALVTTSTNSAYLICNFTGSATIGSNTVTSAGASDILLIGISASGGFTQQTRLGGTADEYANDMILINNSDLMVCGVFRGRNGDIGGNAIGNNFPTTGEALLFQYNINAGRVGYATTYGNAGSDSFVSLAPGTNGVCYVTGSFNSASILLNNRLMLAGATDSFVAAIDAATGTAQWATHLSGANNTVSIVGQKLTADSNGNLIAAGTLDGPVSFGGQQATVNGNAAYVAQLTSAGTVQWVKTIDGQVNARGLMTDGMGAVLLGGYFRQAINFDNITLTPASTDDDGFVARLINNSPPPTYCVPGNFSGCGTSPITRVQITGTTLDNASTCQNNSFGNAFAEYPATGSATGTVQQGVSYQFGVTSSVSATTLAAWADWNQNGTFEASEYIGITGGATANVPALTWLTVPSTATLGLTKIRIRSRASNSTINTTDACSSFASGESEDYIITIAAAPTPTSPYCTPGNFTSNCSSSYITRVQITGGGLDNTSNCQVNTNGNAYTVFQPTGNATGTVQQGVSYQFGVTSNTSATTLAGWVDWNQNGNFEASEYISLTGGATANVPALTWLTVPSTAALGQTRLRLRSRASNSTINTTDACAFFGSGETEDYTITVAAAPTPTSPYCTPGNFTSNCQGSIISRVQLTGTTLDNSSSCQVNTNGNAWTIFQPTGTATATVQQGVSYQFGVTSPTSSTTLAAWIDWNQNGIFDVSEYISITGGATANVPALTWLTVPSTAALGQTRMRLRSRASNSTINTTDGCSFFGSGETEDYTITVVAAPTPTSPYCTPGNFTSNCQGSNISRVQIVGGGLDNTSSCQVNSFGNAWTVFQPTGTATGTVQQGVSYQFGVTSPTSSTTLAAWIDWNQNGIFDVSEYISVTGGATAGVPAQTWISVPSTAALGQTRMRVRSRASNSTINTTDGCSFFGSGETEDYTITVAAGPNPAPLYCTPGNFTSNCQSAVISKVQITGSGLSNTSSCQVDNFGNSYSVFQPTGAATGTVQRSVSYQMAVTSSSANATLAAWIDWDQNGVFDTGEYISISGGTSANVAANVGFTVPPNATLGQTRLRVRSRANNSTVSASDGCSFFASGETEDYTITVGAAPSPAPTYCTPGNFSSNCNGAIITQVQLTGSGLTNSSTCQVDANGNAYIQFPGSGTTLGVVQPGTTYALRVTTASSATVVAWADWNRNNTFDFNEGVTVFQSNTTGSVGLSVPSAAVNGLTTLRVRSRNGSISAADACGFFSSGETEDYVIQVGGTVQPSYCTPGNFNGCNNGNITRVALANTALNNTSTCQTNGNGNAYTEYPASGSTTGSVAQGTTYGLTVTPTAAFGALGVWVDWNQNTTFESGEYQAISTSTSANVPATVGLVVPATATLGQTRMRIRFRTDAGLDATTGACANFNTGETEDYTLTVVSGPNPVPTYCVPGNFSGGCSRGTILRVKLAGTTLDNPSTCATNAFGNAYAQYPASGSTTGTVAQGTTYGLTVTPDASFGALVVWVDWNRNNTFETSEYQVVRGSTTANAAHTIGLIVPATASLGQTMMRVRFRTDAGISNTDACATYNTGETEDYPLTVVSGPNPVPVYCVPGNFSGGCTNGVITRVKLYNTPLDNASTCATNTFGNAYTEYPASGSTTGTVAQGTAYGLSVTVDSNFGAIGVWADWNRNNSFEANEYQLVRSSTSLNTPHTIGLIVPATASVGQTRLRVRFRTDAGISDTDPCSTFNTGETEDYTITVVSGPNPVPQYCVPGNFSGGCSAGTITRVVLTGTTLNNPSTCAINAFGNAFVEYPASGATTATVQPGTTYALAVTPSQSFGALGAWVDWNRNNTFEASEYTSISSSTTANQAVSVGLSVPANASLGQTMMRVRFRTDAGISTTDGCAIYATGETEDYPITVSSCSLAAPTISVSGGTSACAGSNLTLSATGVPNGASYLWNGPGGFSSTQASPQLPNVQPANGGAYSLTITLSNCSATSNTLNLTVNALPSVAVQTSRSPALCQGETVTLTATGATSYVWSNGATTASITVGTAGTYTVTGTGSGNCQATSSPVTVTVSARPTATITAGGPTTFCQGGSVTLTASGGGSYLWSTGATTPSITVTTSGQYTVTATNAASCSATSQPVTVTVNPQPSANFSYSNSTYCRSGTNPTPTVGGTSGGTFSATPAGLSLNASTGQINLTNSTAGTYTVTYAIGGACPAQQTQTVTITSAPLASFSYPNSTSCAGSATTLAPLLGTGATAGTFSATPAGLGLNLTTGVIDLSTSTAGTYTVTNAIAASGGCAAASATTQVSISATPTATITASGPTTFCQGGSVMLTASGGGAYVWSTGATTPSITVTTSGQYSVTATNAAGCSAASSAVSVTVNPTPSAAFNYAGSTFCRSGANPTPVVTGVAGGTFSATPAGLSLNATTGQINLTNSTAGTYTVTYAVAGTCPAQQSQTVTITTAPLATFSYPTGTPCAGSAGTVTPSFGPGASGGTFSAVPAGLGLNAATGVIDLSTSAAGTYTVTNTIAASGSCPAATATATITLQAAPSASITAGGPTTFCQGGSVTLTASGGGAYVWSTGATTPSITVTTSGQYTVTATNAASCSATSQPVTVTVNPQPSAAFNYAGSTFCRSGANPTPVVTGVAGGTFSATPAGLSLNATTGQINLTNSTAGTYTVTYAVAGTCPAQQSQTVTITTAPLATFSYPTGTPCAGSAGTVTPSFGSGASGGTFSAVPAGLGLNAATGVIDLSTSAAGTYTVTNTIAASGSCPAATATATITLQAAPSAAFAYPATTFCLGGTNPTPSVSGTSGGTFSATPAGLSLNASTGQINLTNSTAGTYTVTYAVSGNCPAQQSQTITLTTAPSASFSYPYPNGVCAGAPSPAIITLGTGAIAGIFTAVPAGLVFIDPATGWVDLGQTTPGTYTVTNTVAASGSCAAAQATATLTVLPAGPVPTITSQPQGNGAVLLTASAATSYQWFFNGGPIPGATSQTYLVTSAAQNGTYTVQAFSAGPCPGLSAPTTVTITAAPAELTAATVQLFPNPTSGLTLLTLPAQHERVDISISDATGRIVGRYSVHSGKREMQLDMQPLPTGVYILRLQAAQRVITRRLIRE